MSLLRGSGRKSLGQGRAGISLGVGLAQRARVRREHSPRTVARWILIGVFFAVIGGLTFTTVRQSLAFLTDNPLYAIQRIEVGRTSFLSSEEVVALSGVAKGDNLLRLSLQQIRKRLMEYPNIKDAEIMRQLPNVLRIEIQEREPVAQIIIDKNYLVDEEGAVLTWNDKFAALDLPLLEGVDLKSKVVDNKIQSESLTEVLNILQLFRASLLMARMDIKKVNINGPGGYIFITNKEIELLLSSGLRAQEIQEKFEQLGAVLDDCKRREVEIETVDMRFKDVVVSPKAATGAKKK